jgi:GTP1/Obg family GTP-binding protein
MPQLAHAQAADQPTTSAPSVSSSSTADTVDDATISKFAAAYTEVSAIQTEAVDQLKTTTDPQKAEEVKRNAETRAVRAVQSTGLKPEEFNSIAQRMQSDEKLRTRVAAKINEHSGGG